jgi:hypothetical protein
MIIPSEEDLIAEKATRDQAVKICDSFLPELWGKFLPYNMSGRYPVS